MKRTLKQVIIGDYVCTPIKNVFNSKVAYWLSKKDCLVSMYMFSVDLFLSDRAIDYYLTVGLGAYLALYEQKYLNDADGDQFQQISEKVQECLAKEKRIYKDYLTI